MHNLHILLLIVFVAVSAAGSITHHIDFDPADLTVERPSVWSSVYLEGCHLRGAAGAPLLPAASGVFVIPAGSEQIRVEAYPSVERFSIDAGLIKPSPELRPLNSTSSIQTCIMDESIYSSNEHWPESVLISTHIGNLCGFTVVSFMIQPFSYTPLSGELSLYRSIDINITWTDGNAESLTQSQIEAAIWRLSALVDNPMDIASCAPAGRGSTQQDVDYLIICDSTYSQIFTPLVELNMGKGRSSEVLELHDVIADYPGIDDPEKLRNCLIDYWQNRGTIFVLLAGDETAMPVRFINIQCEGNFDYAPVDQYFSDLDGTWDGNGDGNYGQPDDDLDLYADVLLGRALFGTTDDAVAFVEKTITYQSSPPPGDWYREAVLCGAVLFDEIGYIGGKGCDSIASAIPASWDVVKAYEVLNGDGIDTHIAYISDGSGWNHYAGHGNVRGVYWKSSPMGMMTNWIAQDLENGERTGIHTSIACSPGKYQEEECCAEVLLHHPDGGAVSVIFNTSFGWEGYWPELGPSELMCIDIARQVFLEQAPTLGLAFATAKDLRIPWIHGEYDRTFQSLLVWTAFHDPSLIVRGVPSIAPVPPPPPPPIRISSPYPNPATRDAPVAFHVSFSGSAVDILVYDLTGRLMWHDTIAENSRVVWDGTDSSGQRVPAGLYLITARKGNSAASRRVTVLD